MRIARLRVDLHEYAGKYQDAKVVGLGRLTCIIPAGAHVLVLDEWTEYGPYRVSIQEIATGKKASCHYANLDGLSALESLAYVDYDPYVVDAKLDETE